MSDHIYNTLAGAVMDIETSKLLIFQTINEYSSTIYRLLLVAFHYFMIMATINKI